jgi:hypothetical protein
MRVRRVVKVMMLMLACLALLWGVYSHSAWSTYRSTVRAHAIARLQALAFAIQDGLKDEGHLPESQEGLWEFLAGDTPIRGSLAMLCRDPQGKQFKYERLSTNRFAVSFEGNEGKVEFVCDSTNVTLRFPQWQKWQEFKKQEATIQVQVQGVSH